MVWYIDVCAVLCVQELVELGAGRVVDLDQPSPFLGLLRPQEVKRFSDGGHLLFGAPVASCVGDHRDDSCTHEKDKKKKININQKNPTTRIHIWQPIINTILRHKSVRLRLRFASNNYYDDVNNIDFISGMNNNRIFALRMLKYTGTPGRITSWDVPATNSKY